jgi:hypothetical protein
MKNILSLILISALIATTSFAQNPTGKIILNKGEKLLITMVTIGAVTMDMMGQSMETLSQSSISSILEAKDITTAGYMISNTINKVKMNTKGGMVPAIDFDSDKKEDMNSEIGKNMKDKFEPEISEITFTGRAIEKNAGKNDDDLAKVFQNMISGISDNGSTSAFMLLPSGKKAGDVWTDSSNDNGIKITNEYTLKQIIGKEAVIAVNTKSNLQKTVNAQGMELTIAMDLKITTNNIVDITSGIIKEKNTKLEGKGNMGAAGQEIPMSTKATSVTTTKVI